MVFSIIYEKSKDNLTLLTECVCPSSTPSDSYIENLTPNEMTFGRGALIKEAPESSFTASAI